MKRFDREVPGSELRGYLPANTAISLLVTIEDGNPAFTLSVSDVMVLALYGMVKGRLRKDSLRRVILTVPRNVALSHLNRCRMGSQAKADAVTRMKQKKGAARWVTQLTRAKHGVSGFSGNPLLDAPKPHSEVRVIYSREA